MNPANYCRKNDAEIQHRIDRGIWRPSLDTGHIYSTLKKANLSEAVKNGYRVVTDHYQTFHVSRIIWIAAHGIPPADREIDHINGDKEDNRLCNLQLVTHAENKLRSSAVLTFVDAEEIRQQYKDGMSKTSLAERYGVSRTTIAKIVDNRCYQSKPPHERNAERAEEEIARIGTDAVEEILTQSSRGHSVRQIASRWNISITAVNLILRRAV